MELASDFCLLRVILLLDILDRLFHAGKLFLAPMLAVLLLVRVTTISGVMSEAIFGNGLSLIVSPIVDGWRAPSSFLAESSMLVAARVQ